MRSMPAIFLSVALLPFGAQTTFADDFKLLTPSQLSDLVPPGKHGAVMSDHDNFKSLYADRTDQGNSVETHEHWSHYIEIISGDGSITYGGTVIGERETSPGEKLGTSVEGGKTVSVRPGDYVQIPAGTPHLIKAVPGMHLRYLVMNLHQ